MTMPTDCQCMGIERCGLDVQCASCCADPGDCCEATAQSYFDVEGNEGTCDEVYS